MPSFKFFQLLIRLGRREPKDGVGQRIKSWIADEEPIITGVATNNVFKNLVVSNVDFPTAIYKFGRTSIVHEGELDERLKISEKTQIKIGNAWELPCIYIFGLIIALILAKKSE